ncbi:MAG: cell division protein FtsX [Acidimicrobiales bacterium]
MAVNIQYVTRETVSNLRRNVSMASAALLTVAVSLTLVGGALLVKRGVDRATVQWKGNVELSIFMKPDAAPSESEAVNRQLESMRSREVKSFRYMDKVAALEEYRSIFANDPDVRDVLTIETIPPSYRVVPQTPEQTNLIGQRFENTAGVQYVSYAKEEVDALVSVTNFLQVGLWGVAIVLLGAASLLILNTIRMAIFARRREVAVMKLVGATNWFIRIPFMLEGLIQGLAGAVVAYGIIWIGRGVVESRVVGARNDVQLFKQFLVTTGDVTGTGVLLLLVGVGVGTIGSALAVSRFLDV